MREREKDRERNKDKGDEMRKKSLQSSTVRHPIAWYWKILSCVVLYAACLPFCAMQSHLTSVCLHLYHCRTLAISRSPPHLSSPHRSSYLISTHLISSHLISSHLPTYHLLPPSPLRSSFNLINSIPFYSLVLPYLSALLPGNILNS